MKAGALDPISPNAVAWPRCATPIELEPQADALGRQTGGWTIAWQGEGERTRGTTIREAFESVTNLAETLADADTAVIVLSEAPYAEFMGDSESVDTLPPEDFELLARARAAGKDVVAVILSGRPVLITDALEQADAWVAAWLPGTEGQGVVDVLFGDHAPTGRLGHSWPRSDAQVDVNFGDPGYDPLFELGHGLSY